ncbi:MAG: efflux RND transporter periplasmic adaptor subunit [Caldilinea sp.]
MSFKQKPKRRGWLIGLAVVAVVAIAGYFAATRLGLLGQGGEAGAANRTAATGAAGAATNGAAQTVAIQPATLAQGAVSASGQFTLVDERSVPLAVGGIVQEIDVAVGAAVPAGAVLLKLETTDLEQAVEQSQLSVETAKIALEDLKATTTSADLAQAQAALVEAQQNLESVKAGPSAEEIAAAHSALAAAQASYDELVAGASQEQLTQLSADLKKKEIALQDAQRAYDQVAWRGGSSAEATTLQDATIDYESSKAAYAEATSPPTASQVQSDLSSIQSARVQLNDLLNSPTTGEVATAAAQLAQAEATLANLQTGPTANELRSAEITLEKALIDLANANRDLVAAMVTAPIAGVVMSLNAELGVRQAADSIVATVADPNQLELVVNVAESDIPNVALNQAAQVEIDALPGKTFEGVVRSIAPINTSGSSSVSYPVTVRLTDSELAGVLPGMNAVATLENQASGEGSWLVPTNALRENNGAAMVMVIVVRNGASAPVVVTRGAVQGEWTVVQSPELQTGDEVIGTVTSRLNEQRGGFFGGAPPGAIPGGGGARRP